MRPVIGITAYEEQPRWGAWDQRAVLIPAAYVRAVEAAGGAAMVLPVQSEGLDALVARVDGLVLSGGPDVDPGRYGEAAHPETQEARTSRDAYELGLLAQALDRRAPVLAVCRGLQLLNVARGGTLLQHLPDVIGSDRHSPHPGSFSWHPVSVEPGSRLAGILPAPTVDTASHHHQAVDRLGTGLEVCARAPDGTIEAVEDPALPFVVAVQWHPEAGEEASLFEALVATADAYRAMAQPSQ